MFLPRRTIQEVGMLDESHPMYLEDIDYCYRVQQSGRMVFYLAGASIIHYGGQSSVKVSSKARLLSLEAHRLFLARYGKYGDAGLFRFLVVLALLIRLPAFVGARVFARFSQINRNKIHGVDLRRELDSLLWALGIKKAPAIESVRI